MTSLILFIAMPFLGVRIGISMLSGGGDTTPPTPTGDGAMDFSIATGDNTGLLALLEDI